jgi:hypothetical protein
LSKIQDSSADHAKWKRGTTFTPEKILHPAGEPQVLPDFLPVRVVCVFRGSICQIQDSKVQGGNARQQVGAV